MKFEAVWRSFNFWQKKCRQRLTLKKGWNFDIFSKFSEIHETYRIYWNHLQEHVCEIWSSLEKFQFLTEKCRQRRTLKRMKFWHFLKVLRNSWNLQNLLESPPGTCMWNLKQFGEVSIVDRKMPTAPDLRKRMKFWHFLKVLRNSWNLQNLLESPPGTCMCNLKQFGKVSIFDRKMPTAPDLRKRMKFGHFLKVLRNSWNLQNLLESLPGTCMWNLEQFGEVSIFDRKMPTAPDLRKRMKFWHFSKFSKIYEIYRIYWNHLQEHACEIWSSLEKFQFLTEKCRQRRTLEKGWNFDISQSSPKFMKLTEFIGITSRNMHVQFEAVWKSNNFLQKNADSAGP